MFPPNGLPLALLGLLLTGAAAALLMSIDYWRGQGGLKFEFPVLVLLASTGMLMMISAPKNGKHTLPGSCLLSTKTHPSTIISFTQPSTTPKPSSWSTTSVWADSIPLPI